MFAKSEDSEVIIIACCYIFRGYVSQLTWLSVNWGVFSGPSAHAAAAAGVEQAGPQLPGHGGHGRLRGHHPGRTCSLHSRGPAQQPPRLRQRHRLGATQVRTEADLEQVIDFLPLPTRNGTKLFKNSTAVPSCHSFPLCPIVLSQIK